MAPDSTLLDARIYSDTPMSGEGSGLGGQAPALAGCLGKVQEQLASLDNCPWCAAKGLTYALRSYHINLHETIILCTRLQCLFPLVSRPLEDILASLVPPDPQTGVKRKSSSGETDDPVPSSKRLRAEEEAESRLQGGDVTHTSGPDATDMEVVDKNKHLLLETEVMEGYHEDSDWPVQEEMDQEVVRDEESTAVSKKMAATVDLLLSPGEAVPPSEEAEGREKALAAPAIEKTGPFLTEDHSPISHKTALSSDEAASTSEEAASTSEEAVSPPAEAVVAPEAASEAVSSEREEDVLSMEEDVQAELPLVAAVRRCSTDVHPLRIADKEEDPPSPVLTTPAPDREELGETEQKCCTTEDKPTALDNQELARLKSRKVAEVKPVLNQGLVCSNEMVPVPSHLFWRNQHKLCWLDTLMVAMVNCRTLRESRPKVRPKRSALWELCETYDQTCALIRDHRQVYQDGMVRVPSGLLQMVTDKMNAQRMSMVNLLQPKLRCKLGQEETPVFAMPLLLRLDSWAEPQFQPVYWWEFLCCNRRSKNRCIKTLSTFTKVLSDWHPLRAVHQARCGVCHKQNVTRRMVLESVPPVFALHFEQGLPEADVGNYSFSFHDNHYSVTMVIQYLLQKHFVTWIRKPDGSWLEFDDLKHPDCFTHSKLPIPAHETHMVFWERETDGQNLQTCSSSDGFTETPSVVRQLDRSLEAKDFLADEPIDLLDQSHDLSLPVPQDYTGIVEALTVSSDEEVTMDTNVAADSSIGSTTLLDAFEGLSHNDIVTLTLVEVMVDSEGRPLDDDGQVPENGLSSSCEVPPHSPAPDTPPHSPAPDTPPHSPAPDTPPHSPAPDAPPHSPAPDAPPDALKTSHESSPELATSVVPCGIILPSVMSTSSEVTSVEITTPASPIPSATPSAQPLSQTNVGPSPPTIHKSGWSYMLSNHPAVSLSSTSTPNTQRKPPQLANRSSAVPLRRPPPLKVVKPLRNEDNEALPAKAADMFGGFSARSTNFSTQPKTATAPHTLSPPRKINHGATQNGSSKVLPQPCGPFQRNSSINTTAAASVTPHPPPGVTELPKISSKKHGGHQSKVPPGINDTGALRYKLLKKLKAKKKRLEELNQRLGFQGGAGVPGDSTPKPDSTALDSPYAVSSTTSVYDSPVYDEFFAELLSPTTTTSNLSPDSTGFLEKMANGQEGGGDMAYVGRPIGGARQENAASAQLDKLVARPVVDGHMTTTHDNFLDEFISGATMQQQTDIETEALNALEMFF